MEDSYCEDAQYICSESYASLPKRQRLVTTPLFDSPTRTDSDTTAIDCVRASPISSSDSSDGAVFPSDLSSLMSSQNDGAVYPSESAESDPCHTEASCGSSEGLTSSDVEGQVTLDSAMSDAPLRESSSKHSPGAPMSHDNDEQLEHVANVLVSSCCPKQCLFHLTAHDVLTT